MQAEPVPVQFFQVAATVIPLLLITVGLTQAPLYPDGARDKWMQLLTRLTTLSLAVLGLAGSLAALRYGSDPVRLNLTLLGLVFGLLFAGYGLARKIVQDLSLDGRSERASRLLAFVVALAVGTAAITVLTGGSLTVPTARTYRPHVDWTAAGVVIPMALAIYAIYVQRRDRKTDRADAARTAIEADQRADRAQETADQATAASERAAAATERLAKATEDQALAAARAAPEPQAAWTLEHTSGDSFLLTNAGDATAHDVEVDDGDLRAVPTQAAGLNRESVQPGEGIGFLAGLSLGTRDATITVTWATEPGGSERKRWSRPLPPTPPRPTVPRRIR